MEDRSGGGDGFADHDERSVHVEKPADVFMIVGHAKHELGFTHYVRSEGKVVPRRMQHFFRRHWTTSEVLRDEVLGEERGELLVRKQHIVGLQRGVMPVLLPNSCFEDGSALGYGTFLNAPIDYDRCKILVLGIETDNFL